MPLDNGGQIIIDESTTQVQHAPSKYKQCKKSLLQKNKKKSTAVNHINKSRHNNFEATGLLYSKFTILTRLLCPVWASKLQTDMKSWKIFNKRATKKMKGLESKVYEEKLQKGDYLTCKKDANGDLISTFQVANSFKILTKCALLQLGRQNRKWFKAAMSTQT